jgi:hypothetical protein
MKALIAPRFCLDYLAAGKLNRSVMPTGLCRQVIPRPHYHSAGLTPTIQAGLCSDPRGAIGPAIPARTEPLDPPSRSVRSASYQRLVRDGITRFGGSQHCPGTKVDNGRQRPRNPCRRGHQRSRAPPRGIQRTHYVAGTRSRSTTSKGPYGAPRLPAMTPAVARSTGPQNAMTRTNRFWRTAQNWADPPRLHRGLAGGRSDAALRQRCRPGASPGRRRSLSRCTGIV